MILLSLNPHYFKCKLTLIQLKKIKNEMYNNPPSYTFTALLSHAYHHEDASNILKYLKDFWFWFFSSISFSFFLFIFFLLTLMLVF